MFRLLVFALSISPLYSFKVVERFEGIVLIVWVEGIEHKLQLQMQHFSYSRSDRSIRSIGSITPSTTTGCMLNRLNIGFWLTPVSCGTFIFAVISFHVGSDITPLLMN